MEGFITLFDNTPAEGNRPHYKGYFKIDGVDHEFALWPSKSGKKGFSGKYKPKEARVSPETQTQLDAIYEEKPIKANIVDDEIPFAYLIAGALSGAMLSMQYLGGILTV